MKTALLFSAGADSSYLAYKILHDTSDDLTIYILTGGMTPYNPLWVSRPHRVKKTYNVINELKKIREFEVHHEEVDVKNITFEIDHPVPYAMKSIIPKLNDGTYDRVAIGYSWDQHSLRYFKTLNMNGVSGDKIAKKIFDREATRGYIWMPLMTHEIHDRYGKYHAFKYLPEEIQNKMLSCEIVNEKNIGCGVCGKCAMNVKVKELMDKNYSSDDIQQWMEERSLIFGGGKRNASPVNWMRLMSYGGVKVTTGVSIPSEMNKTYTVSSRQQFVNWWDTMEFNSPSDNLIRKWDKSIKDYLEILL